MPKTTLVDTRTALIPEIRRALGKRQIRSINRELTSGAKGIRFEGTDVITYGSSYQTVLFISPVPEGAEKRMKAMRLSIFRTCTKTLDGLEIRVDEHALPCRLRAEVGLVVEVLFGKK